MRKSTLSTSMVVALALALGACGDNASTTAPAPTPAGGATPAAGTQAVATALKAEADKALTDVSDYIKNNKWDLADKGMARLQEIKPQLPPEYGPKIDDLKKMYDAAKAAAAGNTGGMPAMSMPKIGG